MVKQLAIDEAINFPLASAILEKCGYVDDFLWSCRTVEEAQESIVEVEARLNTVNPPITPPF